ncbi:hypothetical protein VNO80_24349 [Phaseolus coccineus]|uniref:Secreted protein n=1 Tax=Phaseolus coccineus TaxID=3886 RepID=A0AAN9QKZ0_PHACN
MMMMGWLYWFHHCVFFFLNVLPPRAALHGPTDRSILILSAPSISPPFTAPPREPSAPLYDSPPCLSAHQQTRDRMSLKPILSPFLFPLND